MSPRDELVEIIEGYLADAAPTEIIAEAIVDAGYVKESCCCGVCGL